MIRPVLRAQGAYLPEQKLSSEAIELKLLPLYERLRLPQGRLELMSGIQERGLWPRGTRPSELATKAAQNLLEAHKVLPQEIDLLIFASVCRDQLEPASASHVHANLKLPESTPFFDLSNACLGVLSATEMAMSLVKAQTHKNILIVSGENAGPLIETTIETLLTDQSITRKSMKKYLANLTIGSGAVAWLISNEQVAPHAPLLSKCLTLADSSSNHLCQGSGTTESLVMETDSEALLQAGILLARKTWIQLDDQQVDWVIGHQVGEAHERAILSACELNHKKTHRTYPHLGNTGSAALPLTLWELSQKDELASGDRLALLGIGSGLACTMLTLEWRTSDES